MQTLVCLDRKQSPLTFDPGPLCRCERRTRVYLPAFASRAGSFSRRFPRNRWSSFLVWVWAACAGAQVSCPEGAPGERWGGGVYYAQCQRAAANRHSPRGTAGREGRAEGKAARRKSGIVRCKTSAHTFVTPEKKSPFQEEEEEAVMSRRQLLLRKSC